MTSEDIELAKQLGQCCAFAFALAFSVAFGLFGGARLALLGVSEPDITVATGTTISNNTFRSRSDAPGLMIQDGN